MKIWGCLRNEGSARPSWGLYQCCNIKSRSLAHDVRRTAIRIISCPNFIMQYCHDKWASCTTDHLFSPENHFNVSFYRSELLIDPWKDFFAIVRSQMMMRWPCIVCEEGCDSLHIMIRQSASIAMRITRRGEESQL